MSITHAAARALIPALFILTAGAEGVSSAEQGSRPGILGAALIEIIEHCPSDSVLSVIVELDRAVDARARRADLLAAGATERRIHRSVMEELRGEHGRSQDLFLRRLEQSADRGAVRRVNRFWIANVVVLDAEAGGLDRIAHIPGVRRVSLNRTIRLQGSVKKRPGLPSAVDWNIERVGARNLWQQGYTGRGVLVCIIDSGLDVEHPALAGRWRGNNVPGSAAAWFDPYNFSSSPVDDDVNLGPTHGTSAMGIICGAEGADTVGVAPGAQWIAANAFEGPFQTSTNEVILECFEWAADPDGDPATVFDVPDIINNSWGTNEVNGSGLCEDVFWSAIDAVEALGTAVFFAAGNFGSDPMTIASPASRAASDVNTFAVGATTEFDAIAQFSARGPSPCDEMTIKPEAVAPGQNVVSSRGREAGGGYQYVSGTSFSTPHVSGVAALLRQRSSSSTVDEIKRAILETAADLGDPGEDNTFGRGMIGAGRASAELGGPTAPDIRLVRTSPLPLELEQGETVELAVALYNIGTAAAGVSARLTDESGLVDVLDGSTELGTIDPYGTKDNAGDPFTLLVSSDAVTGMEVGLRLSVSWSTGEEEYLLTGSIREETTAGWADLDAGNVVFTVTNFGQYGFHNGTTEIGSGFRFPSTGTDWLYRAFFLTGTGPSTVSDGGGGLDTDWRPVPGGAIVVLRSGGKADQEARATYDDREAPNPLPLEVDQRAYAFSDPLRDEFVILEYRMKNTGSGTLEGVYTGLYFDWDLNSITYLGNEVGWVDSLDLGYMYDADYVEHVGVGLLEGPFASHRAIDNRAELQDSFGNPVFPDSKKWNFLTAGLEQPTSTGTVSDWSHLISAGPITIPAGDSARVAFSVVAGMGLAELTDNAAVAEEAWDSLDSDPPPTFVISILADAVLSEYLKISAVPGEPLEGVPAITVDGDALDVSTITGGDVTVYTGDYVVETGGDHLVTVSGVDLSGTSGTSTEWFTALGVSPDRSGTMVSRDGSFSLSLPRGAVGFEGYIYAMGGAVESVPLPGGFRVIRGPYALQPAGYRLLEEAEVAFGTEGTGVAGDEMDSMVILVLGPGGWREIETSVEQGGEGAAPRVTAKTGRLSTLLLAVSTPDPGVPGSRYLAQNFPNPFNPQTTIGFVVPEGETTAHVRIEIFDLRGHLVKTLVDRDAEPGRYNAVWDGRNAQGERVSSGVYLYTLRIGGFSQTRKMVLVR